MVAEPYGGFWSSPPWAYAVCVTEILEVSNSTESDAMQERKFRKGEALYKQHGLPLGLKRSMSIY